MDFASSFTSSYVSLRLHRRAQVQRVVEQHLAVVAVRTTFAQKLSELNMDANTLKDYCKGVDLKQTVVFPVMLNRGLGDGRADGHFTTAIYHAGTLYHADSLNRADSLTSPERDAFLRDKLAKWIALRLNGTEPSVVNVVNVKCPSQGDTCHCGPATALNTHHLLTHLLSKEPDATQGIIIEYETSAFAKKRTDVKSDIGQQVKAAEKASKSKKARASE